MTPSTCFSVPSPVSILELAYEIEQLNMTRSIWIKVWTSSVTTLIFTLFVGASTLFHSESGIVVNNVVIDRKMLRRYILCMPGTTEDSVDKLLYPQDPMDVPRAIKLIQAVASLCSLDKSQFDPGQQKTINAIQLTGSIFHCLTQPFLNHDLNLTKQFVSLSKYSHMALALYR